MLNAPTLDPIPEIIDTLDDEYHLVYIDPQDHLSGQQLRQITAGDYDGLYDSIDLAYSEQQADIAYRYAEDAVDAWTAAHGEPDDFDRDDAIFQASITIRDRDVSTPLRDCLDNTRCPLLRVPLITEDADCNNWVAPAPAHYLRTAGLPITSTTVETMRNLIAETPSDLHEGWVIFRADIGALLDTGDDLEAAVTITDPTIILGNGFTGAYWHAQFTGCVLTVRRGAVTIDGDGGPYSVDDCYGGFPLDGPDATITPTVTPGTR
jgi:hypothetical protein